MEVVALDVHATTTARIGIMDIRTVIIGGTPNMLLAGWLKRKGIQYGVGYSDESGEIARNREVVDFLAGPADDEAMLFLLDADIAPGPGDGLDNMLSKPGDLIYCGHPARSLRCGHFGDGNLATGCMRATRRILREVGSPWFVNELNAQGTSVAQCSCNRFARLARERVGVDSRMVGKVYHITKVLATIDATGKIEIVPFGVY